MTSLFVEPPRVSSLDGEALVGGGRQPRWRQPEHPRPPEQ